MKKHLINRSLSITKNKLKVGLIQLSVTKDKSKNIENAISKIEMASKEGVDLVVLPECFNSPYGALQSLEGVGKYAEEFANSETVKSLQRIAKEKKITIVGGSIPLKEDDKFYNTSFTFDSNGEIIAKHQKIHLFDINIPNQIVYEESKILKGGKNLTMFEIEKSKFKVGLGICFDVRFAELSQIYQRNGCNLLVFPGAFNMTTGPAHWNLLARCRAIDNQSYVILCSPARDENASYVAYGHSMVVNPWGKVLVEASEKEEILYCEIDVAEVEKIRDQLPVVKNKKKYYDLKFKI